LENPYTGKAKNYTAGAGKSPEGAYDKKF